jgi:ribonuclease PH
MESDFLRKDGRKTDELRFVKFIPDFIDYPEGSVLVQMGKTRVLCNVTIEESVPGWMTGRGKGWMTAEYAMLPRATHTRTERETEGPGARSQEIKRLIGRSLRKAVDLTKLGERTILLDCDVLQADGGTRTASITGGYVALAIALNGLIKKGICDSQVLQKPVAAVSVGILDGQEILDLCYVEDSNADVDMNVVMTEKGEFIEIQGTSEGLTFQRSQMNSLLDLAEHGISKLIELQKEILADRLKDLK